MKTLLEKLRALAQTEAQATPPPWCAAQDEAFGGGIVNAIEEVNGHICATSGNAVNNANLIADSRNLLRPLLALVEAQHAALEAVETAWDISRSADEFYARTVLKILSIRAALVLANQEQP